MDNENSKTPLNSLEVPSDPNCTRRDSTHGQFYHFASKIMLVGDTCTGKTCLLLRFKNNTFLNNNFISTIGIDYKNKVVDVDGTKVKLQIWDTAGQERFRSVTHGYYRDANGILLLFDVTNPTSFQNTRSWLSEIKEFAATETVVVLVGNKCDNVQNRRISVEVANKLAEEYGVHYIETSAKSGHNVDLAFMTIAKDLVSSHFNTKNERGPRVSIVDRASRRSNFRCCWS